MFALEKRGSLTLMEIDKRVNDRSIQTDETKIATRACAHFSS